MTVIGLGILANCFLLKIHLIKRTLLEDVRSVRALSVLRDYAMSRDVRIMRQAEHQRIAGIRLRAISIDRM